jgi:hypothetical protein
MSTLKCGDIAIIEKPARFDGERFGLVGQVVRLVSEPRETNVNIKFVSPKPSQDHPDRSWDAGIYPE